MKVTTNKVLILVSSIVGLAIARGVYVEQTKNIYPYDSLITKTKHVCYDNYIDENGEQKQKEVPCPDIMILD